MQRNTMPRHQHWVLEAMRRLHFRVDDNGECFGLSCMAMQAILCDDLKNFDKRLDNILAFSNHEQVKSDELLDMIAFFNGVVLYDYPHLYKPFLTMSSTLFQSVKQSSELVAPAKLDHTDGISELTAFTNLYTLEDLIQYFTILQAALTSDTNSHSLFALILRSSNHAITVCYDFDKKEWNVFDAPHAAFQRIKGRHAIATVIHRFFTTNMTSNVILHTAVYVNNQDKMIRNSLLNKWIDTNEFTNLNELTSDKITLTDNK